MPGTANGGRSVPAPSGRPTRTSPRGTRRRLVGVAGRVAAAVVPRPRLWRASVREVLRLAEPGWWHRAPYLPLPSAGLWEFRMTTAYGEPGAVPSAADVVSFLEWVDGLDRVLGHRSNRTEHAPDSGKR